MPHQTLLRRERSDGSATRHRIRPCQLSPSSSPNAKQSLPFLPCRPFNSPEIRTGCRGASRIYRRHLRRRNRESRDPASPSRPPSRTGLLGLRLPSSPSREPRKLLMPTRRSSSSRRKARTVGHYPLRLRRSSSMPNRQTRPRLFKLAEQARPQLWMRWRRQGKSSERRHRRACVSAATRMASRTRPRHDRCIQPRARPPFPSRLPHLPLLLASWRTR